MKITTGIIFYSNDIYDALSCANILRFEPRYYNR